MIFHQLAPIDASTLILGAVLRGETKDSALADFAPFRESGLS